MQKWSKAFAIIIILILFFIPTIIAMKYVTISMLYSHFVNSISDLIGINKYLVKAAAALMFIPFLIGVTFLFSINKSRRNIGKAILVSLVIFYNLSLYYFTKDLHFAFSQGKVLKWYALTPDGVRFYDRSGVDPVYGITLKPVTPEVIRNLKLLQKGEFKPVDPTRVQFFNPITGEAQVWYYKYPDETFDFFDKPGYHPITGEPLKPVSKDIYFEWKAKSTPKLDANKTLKANKEKDEIKKTSQQPKLVETPEEAETNKRLQDFISTVNFGIYFPPNKTNVPLVIDANGIKGDFFTNLLKVGNLYLVNNYFKDTFKTKGYFDRIYSGEATLLKQSGIMSKIDYLILGKLDYSFKKGASIDKDLVSCNISLSYKILDKNGSVVKSDVVKAIGPGFSEELSLERGLEILAEKYSTILNKSRL